MVVPRGRKARASRRRRRRLAGRDNDLTEEQWLALVVAWAGCAYCGATGAALQRDCVLPVACGGRYTLGNVVPACGACNMSKSGREVTGWLRRKHLDEAAFLLRHRRISEELSRRFPGTSPASPERITAAPEGADGAAPLPRVRSSGGGTRSVDGPRRS